MQNRVVYILIFLVAALGIAYLITIFNDTDNTLASAQNDFAVTDTAAINKIFVTNKDSRNALLERDSLFGGWKVNNKYKADKAKMELLLSTIRNIKVRRPVNKKERESVIKYLATKSIKIEIYQNDKRVKTYYVGNDATGFQGSYFLMEGSEQPFVCHIPNMEGIPRVRYEVDKRGWRSKDLFDSDPSQWKKIEVSWPDSTFKNFSIENTNTGFAIPEAELIDTNVLRRFIIGLHYASVFKYASARDKEDIDHLVTNFSPFYELKIQFIDPILKPKSIKIWYHDDPDNFLIHKMPENEYASVSLYNFRNLFVGLQDFERSAERRLNATLNKPPNR